MATFTYNRDIPDGPHDPSNDWSLMQTNTNSTDDIIDVDHFSFGEANGGKHKVIHSPVPQGVGTSPGTGALEWAYYTKTLVGGAVETFWQRPNTAPNGSDIQMTVNLSPTAALNGNTFIAGGIIIQWGSFTATSISTFAVTFPTAFPNNCFNVQCTYQVNDGSTIRNGVESGTVTTAGFTWIGTSSSSLIRVNWFAIGN